MKHMWVPDEDGDEFTCDRCGRTVWLQDIPNYEDATLEKAMRNKNISEDCDLEKVRQVMES